MASRTPSCSGHARISGDNASMARVISDSHIDELLWWRTHIHAKGLQKRPLVAPSQELSSFINNSHIGKPSFEGPQFPRKNIEKKPWSTQRGEAQKGRERHREAKKAPERPSVDRTSRQKVSKKLLVAWENAEGLKDVARRASVSHPGPVRRLRAGTFWASLGHTERR